MKCEHLEFTDGCAPCMAECVARLFAAETERDALQVSRAELEGEHEELQRNIKPALEVLEKLRDSARVCPVYEKHCGHLPCEAERALRGLD